MSVVYKDNDSILLDHGNLINKFYENVYENNEDSSYQVTNMLFSIKNIQKDQNRKRSHDASNFHKETMQVKQMYEIFLSEIPTDIKSSLSCKYSLLETFEVRELAGKLFENTVFDHKGISGGNNSDAPLKSKIKEELFMIPAKSRFFCGCVKEQCKKLEGSKFDMLVADPPWWNKYIRRLKNANDKLSYSMMYNEDIASIPVKDLLSPNCLVAVWCTNAPSNIDAVKNLIFPKWGVTYLTTWYWLKVTVALTPVCPFGAGYKKQPYERIMLGKVGHVGNVPESQLIVSVPSALHSHKPPLLDVLKPYVSVANPQTLELFARYLLPNTTSVGYEPLKWQHLSLFESVT